MQLNVDKKSTDVYLARCGLYDHGIVWSPWLDRAKLILIKSSIDCVWVGRENHSHSEV